MPHNQRAAVSPGDEAVFPPAVDLQLVVVESVDQIAGADAVRQRIALRRAERDRRVGERREPLLFDQILAMPDDLPVRPQPLPERRQAFGPVAAAVPLEETP